MGRFGVLAHAIGTTGLQLTETAVDATPKPGEFYHLASRDEHAPPGRLRLLLRDAEEVRKLHAALHGQTVQVRSERVAIEVANSALARESLPGNGGR